MVLLVVVVVVVVVHCVRRCVCLQMCGPADVWTCGPADVCAGRCVTADVCPQMCVPADVCAILSARVCMYMCMCVCERVRKAMPRSTSSLVDTIRLAGKEFPGWLAVACHREMPVCACARVHMKTQRAMPASTPPLLYLRGHTTSHTSTRPELKTRVSVRP